MKPKAKDYGKIDWNELFIEDYTSPTGLKWKVSPAFQIEAGSIAGTIDYNPSTERKCYRVMVNNSKWLVHRIIWCMRHGNIDSSLEIDHLDGNAMNNSFNNLRLVSVAVNSRNHKQRKDNSTGVTGVRFTTTKWSTYATANWYDDSGKQKAKCFCCKKLGLLEAFASACAYREKMIAELNESGAGYSERHGEI